MALSFTSCRYVEGMEVPRSTRRALAMLDERTLKGSQLEVVSAVNTFMMERSQRPRRVPEEALPLAFDYLSCWLDGAYVVPRSGTVYVLDPCQERLLARAVTCLGQYTKSGFFFYPREGDNQCGADVRRGISVQTVGTAAQTRFTDGAAVLAVFSGLVDGRLDSLLSVQEWRQTRLGSNDRPWSFGCGEFDSAYVNGRVKPEAIAYAAEHLGVENPLARG